jgi:pyruvate/2-oxoglutarate dehydrogenase complex dihydrolipoamide acyltransferase (E2) component
MTEKKPVKKVSIFASKAAEELAEAKGLVWPEDKEGSGNNGKVTVKDLKTLSEPKSAKKVNASPTALQYARDNGLDISKIASGSGAEGKILLKDVKDLKVPDDVEKGEESEDDGVKLKISPSAAKLMKQYEIDEEDLAEVEPTGKNGTIVAADLKELIELIKEEE